MTRALALVLALVLTIGATMAIEQSPKGQKPDTRAKGADQEMIMRNPIARNMNQSMMLESAGRLTPDEVTQRHWRTYESATPEQQKEFDEWTERTMDRRSSRAPEIR